MNTCMNKGDYFLAVVREDQWTLFGKIFLVMLSLYDRKVHILWCKICVYNDDWILEVTRVLL